MLEYINNVTEAPKAIGPYSQAVKVGNMFFLSGQIPIDPSTAKLIEGGITEQTEQVMRNITAVLMSQGLTFSNVAKTTIFLSDLKNFQTVNEIYSKTLGENKPARSTVQVAALPLGSLVEIEMIAVKG